MRNPKIIVKNRLPFSQLHEKRFTFISIYEVMTYKYCLEHPKSMCEIKFDQFLDENPELINSLNSCCNPLSMQDYAYVLPKITVDGNDII